MAYDNAVVTTAYTTAKGMGASDKVMLALFEAGIVESEFRNLTYGDRDSVGYLQQRPSQGWQNPMDVPTATRSFVSKAMPIEGRYATAGQLAQAVQRSAFPLKYDAVKTQASLLLAQQSGNAMGVNNASLDVVPVSDKIGNINKALETLTHSGTWVRIGIGMAGILLLCIAIIKLTGDNELSSVTKGAVGLIPGGSAVIKAAKVVT